MATFPKAFSFCGLVSEARTIIRSHYRHFFNLSILFLFPLYFFTIIYPALYFALSGLDVFEPQQWLPRLFTSDPTRTRPAVLPLVFTIFGLCISPCALGTITYSAFNGYYGRPVDLPSSIKSLSRSFLPLISTMIVNQFIVSSIGMVSGVLAAILFNRTQILGFEVNSHSIYFWILVISYVLLLVALTLWIQVNWSLGFVIAALESKWGFEALKRSVKLVKGMRGLASSLMLIYGFGVSFLLITNSLWLAMLTATNKHYLLWIMMVFQVVYCSYLAANAMLVNLAANVVLYIHCKASHGEEALFDVAEEFVSEYASLPFENGKISCDV